MKNLKTLIKESYFKIILGIIILIGIVISVSVVISNCKTHNKEHDRKRIEIIKTYEKRLSEKDSINTYLMNKEKILEKQIDSLYTVKTNIIIRYEDKIKTITNASTNEHAIWMDSICRTKMEDLEK